MERNSIIIIDRKGKSSTDCTTQQQWQWISHNEPYSSTTFTSSSANACGGHGLKCKRNEKESLWIFDFNRHQFSKTFPIDFNRKSIYVCMLQTTMTMKELRPEEELARNTLPNNNRIFGGAKIDLFFVVVSLTLTRRLFVSSSYYRMGIRGITNSYLPITII